MSFSDFDDDGAAMGACCASVAPIFRPIIELGKQYPKISSVSILAVLGFFSIIIVNHPVELGDEAPLSVIPDSLVQTYTGPLSAGASPLSSIVTSFVTGATQSPSPLACAANSCNQSKSGSHECVTMSGKYACVPPSARFGMTTTNQTCRGGRAWGEKCDFWGSRRQELYERWFNGFMRYSWCYTTEKSWFVSSWDYCVAEQPQSFPRWAASEPCLPWTNVTNDPSAEFEVQFLNVSETKYVRSRYRPDPKEWYQALVPDDNACALPSFAAFPSDWQIWNAQAALKLEQQLRKKHNKDKAWYTPSVLWNEDELRGLDYRVYVPDGFAVSSIPWLRRFLVDKNGDRFFGPYCFVQTVLGPRVAQCKAMCREKSCSGHGVCNIDSTVHLPVAQCTCDLGWSGEHCDIPTHGSVSCQDMQRMGLDDDGEFSLFSLVYIWRPISAYQQAFMMLLWPPWGQPTAGHFAFRFVTKFFGVLGVTWLFTALFGCCVSLCHRYRKGKEEDEEEDKTTMACMWWSFVSFMIIFGLPFMILFLLSPFVIFVLPVLAWRKLWHLERALAVCIGPVGINAFVFPAAALLPMLYVIVKKTSDKAKSFRNRPLLSEGNNVRVCATDRVGVVMVVCPEDASLTYKVRFFDAEHPEEDWFPRNAVEGASNPAETPSGPKRQSAIYAVKDLMLAVYGVYSSWATYLASISAKHSVGSILLVGNMSCSTILLTAAILATVVFLGSLLLGWLVDGTRVFTYSWPVTLSILERSPTALVHRTATVLLWTKILFVDGLHILIGVASPFFAREAFVPDFLLYMSAYSAYSLYKDSRKAVDAEMKIASDSVEKIGTNATQEPLLSQRM